MRAVVASAKLSARTAMQRWPPLLKNAATACGSSMPPTALPNAARKAGIESTATGVFTGPRSASPMKAAVFNRTRRGRACGTFSSYSPGGTPGR